MCRMVGYQGTPGVLAPLVYGGHHSLAEQSFAPRELLSGSVNADGFGLVWFEAGQARALKEHRPIWQNPDLKNVLLSLTSSVALAAVRNVTPGLSVDASGTPPLVRGGIALVLNGYLQDFQASFLRESVTCLTDGTLALARGMSDTEFICLEVAQRSTDTDLGTALVETVSRLLASATKKDRVAQLNILASDGRSLVAVRASNTARSNSLYLGRAVSLMPAGLMVASEPLTSGDTWESVPHGSVVDLSTGVVGSL